MLLQKKLYKQKSAVFVIALLLAMGCTSIAGAICASHYYVENLSSDSIKVKVWTTEKMLRPGETGQFQYACWSNLPIQVHKLDGTKTFGETDHGSRIPGDRKAIVNSNYQYKDMGKTESSQTPIDWLKYKAKEVGLPFLGISK